MLPTSVNHHPPCKVRGIMNLKNDLWTTTANNKVGRNKFLVFQAYFSKCWCTDTEFSHIFLSFFLECDLGMVSYLEFLIQNIAIVIER